jgi:hypothetical protein
MVVLALVPYTCVIIQKLYVVPCNELCIYVFPVILAMSAIISPTPAGLRHGPSSFAQTLGSWVRIPLKAWLSVCVYSVIVLFFV